MSPDAFHEEGPSVKATLPELLFNLCRPPIGYLSRGNCGKEPPSERIAADGATGGGKASCVPAIALEVSLAILSCQHMCHVM
mmetsp:Transcript_97720/g.276441  ORF Transcript_97720/g.276441 Transcript_97720/m.276441 type:complete len:82 (+) Transcript_97720:893-1138(+)